MTLFRIENKRAERVPSISFTDEKKEIQQIIGNDKNMAEMFGLKFIKNELHVKNRFIDTLAYDEDTKSFVIFEYKKDRNRSVIDQGYTYLSLMLDNRSDFVLEYINNTNKVHSTKNDFDWTQSRVIFLSPEFTDYQVGATNFKDLPFKLYKIRKYKNDEVSIDEIKPTSTAPSLKSLKTGGIIEKVGDKLKVYTLDYHLEKIKDETVKERVNELRENILKIDESIKEYYIKNLIKYKTTVVFCSIDCKPKHFWVYVERLNRKELNEEALKERGLDIRPHANDEFLTSIRIEGDFDLNSLLNLVKRAYKSTL